jgi:predicted PurR-regulated permease PerM
MRSHIKYQVIMERKKITFDSFIRGSICCALIVGLLILFKRLSGVLLPFFVAWLIAYMIYPLVKFFQYKLRFKSRIISIFCALFSITIVGISLFYLLVPPMLAEMGRMNDLLVTYLTNGAYSSGTVPPTLSEFIHKHIDLQALNRILSEENIMNTIKETVPKLWALVAESINILFSVFASFIILLYVVFILLDYESIAEGWLHLLPGKYRTFASNLVNDIQDGMNRYFRGQAFVAFCVGILFSIGFLIIDFPMAIALGLFIGALNMVPYLQIIGFLPTIVLAILKAAFILLTTLSTVLCSLNLWWDCITFLISKCFSKIPEVRVSSARIKSASFRTLIALNVISSKFPTGVGTTYSFPISLFKYSLYKMFPEKLYKIIHSFIFFIDLDL